MMHDSFANKNKHAQSIKLASPEDEVECHCDAAQGDIWTQSLSYSRTLPEHTRNPANVRERGLQLHVNSL